MHSHKLLLVFKYCSNYLSVLSVYIMHYNVALLYIVQATSQLVNALKTEAESQSDSEQQKKLLAAAKLLADATARMVEAAKVLSTVHGIIQHYSECRLIYFSVLLLLARRQERHPAVIQQLFGSPGIILNNSVKISRLDNSHKQWCIVVVVVVVKLVAVKLKRSFPECQQSQNCKMS